MENILLELPYNKVFDFFFTMLSDFSMTAYDFIICLARLFSGLSKYSHQNTVN